MKLFQVIDGVGFTVPNRIVFPFACCDCGLVHDMVITVSELKRGAEIGVAMRRHNKRTKALRRDRCKNQLNS